MLSIEKLPAVEGEEDAPAAAAMAWVGAVVRPKNASRSSSIEDEGGAETAAGGAGGAMVTAGIVAGG